MKVLVFTATYGDGPRPETLESVKAQKFGGRFQHEVSWYNPFGGSDPRNITAQMDRGRQLALDGSYDALLSVEHDMQLPPDALQRLWGLKAPVAYGTYVFRHSYRLVNAYQKYPGASTNIGESLDLKPKLLEKARKQGVIEVSGVGFGCTLIRREVLDQVPFRNRENEHNGTDTVFAMDCVKAGIRQMTDLNLHCGHWDGKRWLYPFEGPLWEAVRVVARQNVNVRVWQETIHMERGKEYDLPENGARDLQRAGYVAILGGA